MEKHGVTTPAETESHDSPQDIESNGILANRALNTIQLTKSPDKLRDTRPKLDTMNLHTGIVKPREVQINHPVIEAFRNEIQLLAKAFLPEMPVNELKAIPFSDITLKLRTDFTPLTHAFQEEIAGMIDEFTTRLFQEQSSIFVTPEDIQDVTVQLLQKFLFDIAREHGANLSFLPPDRLDGILSKLKPPHFSATNKGVFYPDIGPQVLQAIQESNGDFNAAAQSMTTQGYSGTDPKRLIEAHWILDATANANEQGPLQ
ncbi:MAG: hypothetical protein WCJ84_06540 [Candidatus Peregrinibacteria bacterium]